MECTYLRISKGMLIQIDHNNTALIVEAFGMGHGNALALEEGIL